MSLQERFEFKETPDPMIEDNEYLLKDDPNYRVQAHPFGGYFLANHYRTTEHNSIVLRELGLFETLKDAMEHIVKVWESDNEK